MGFSEGFQGHEYKTKTKLTIIPPFIARKYAIKSIEGVNAGRGGNGGSGGVGGIPGKHFIYGFDHSSEIILLNKNGI